MVVGGKEGGLVMSESLCGGLWESNKIQWPPGGPAIRHRLSPFHV